MKICPNCKNEVEDDVKLCPNCNAFIAGAPVLSQQEVNTQDNNASVNNDKQVNKKKRKDSPVLAVVGLVVAIIGLVCSFTLIPKYPIDNKKIVAGGNFDLLFDGIEYVCYAIFPLFFSNIGIILSATAMHDNNKINIKFYKIATFGLIISIISILICLGGCVTCAF
jgi:hypothetical protein